MTVAVAVVIWVFRFLVKSDHLKLVKIISTTISEHLTWLTYLYLSIIKKKEYFHNKKSF